ncbi:hypothetical protein GKE82_19135 [Conexibacter sp. W3-3-2]|uniref:Hpt domain-containing protein n=1 Tax=Conexibacter sp. W3-3-2 TaxID=2675227 RepID=UPI0012B7B9C9|nr:Hpt domain-containing protein [Conexibacter sp. W3-3-2]MTD46343.1 hypothetical protein [Conexibacter sp. W3-3-2]
MALSETPLAQLPDTVQTAIDKLRGEMGGDGPLRMMVGLWVDQLESLLEDLRLGARHGDGGQLAAAAHRLKGTCALLGAHDLRARAAAIEHAGLDGLPRTVEEDVDRFAVEARAFARLLESLR